jgi:alpha-beta hydrolase superfamily lysophospholipase
MTTEWRVPPPAEPGAFGAFQYWPEQAEWSTQLLRLISYTSLGAAEFSEVERVAASLHVGDDAEWYSAFVDLAHRLDERVAMARDRVTAGETWDRAAIYYRMAATFRSISGEIDIPSVDDSRRCFRFAREADERYCFEQVEIPYGVHTIPGYFLAPRREVIPAPTVIVLGGIDAFAEEMYYKIGAALLARGYNVLLPDGPGQGESRRRRIPARADYEVAISAMVDGLVDRPDVDADRVALIGSSMGGYFAARGAAFEHRLRAAVIWGAFYGIDTTGGGNGESKSRIGQAMAAFAVSTLEELVPQVATFNLEGIAGRISVPTLILHGASDVQVPLAHAHRLFEEISHPDKELMVYPAGQPGCTHCQLDSPLTAHFDILNWLDDRLPVVTN